MSADPQDSVFLVTSSDPNIEDWGTAFAIYSGEDIEGHNGATNFVTCRHVVEAVGGTNRVRITVEDSDYPGKVVALGSEGGPDDLAVLRVDGLHNVPILRFNGSAESGRSVRILGFGAFAEEGYMVRSLKAQLGERGGLMIKGKPGRVAVWDLMLKGRYKLKRGYSGGPVINESSDVVAVANFREGGKKGVALSIEVLEKIGPAIVEEIKGSYRNRFWSSLIAEALPDDLQPVDAAHLQLLEVSPRIRFSHVFGTFKEPTSSRFGKFMGWLGGTVGFETVQAMVDADGFTIDDISALLDKLYYKPRPPDCWHLHFYIDVYFLFLDGCPNELPYFISEQAKLPSRFLWQEETPPIIWPQSVRLWVFDLQGGQIYRAERKGSVLQDAGLTEKATAVRVERDPAFFAFFEPIRLQYPF